jgi:hypothetical protein
MPLVQQIMLLVFSGRLVLLQLLLKKLQWFVVSTGKVIEGVHRRL